MTTPCTLMGNQEKDRKESGRHYFIFTSIQSLFQHLIQSEFSSIPYPFQTKNQPLPIFSIRYSYRCQYQNINWLST